MMTQQLYTPIHKGVIHKNKHLVDVKIGKDVFIIDELRMIMTHTFLGEVYELEDDNSTY
jgi:hypothetical protein